MANTLNPMITTTKQGVYLIQFLKGDIEISEGQSGE